MGYSPDEVAKANKECKHLTGRGGGIINPDYGGNPDCVKSSSGNIATAGFGKIPNFVWGVFALMGVYYIGKQQKWF